MTRRRYHAPQRSHNLDQKPKERKIRYGDSLKSHFDRVNFVAWQDRQARRKEAKKVREFRSFLRNQAGTKKLGITILGVDENGNQGT